MNRPDRRRVGQVRPLKLVRQAMKFAEGSCLVEWGHTKVLCSASVDNKVPPFLKGSGTGWVTAEYGMLPRATSTRTDREASRGKQSGRTQEIQRLIGRSLRSVVDLSQLGERSIWVDCDVLQADGGTRCAAITGSYVALVECLRSLRGQGVFARLPLRDMVAAVSVGIVKGRAMADLMYEEDAHADVDMNVVMTGRGQLVEVQGTAERHPFSQHDLQQLLKLATAAIRQIVALQYRALGARELSAL